MKLAENISVKFSTSSTDVKIQLPDEQGIP